MAIRYTMAVDGGVLLVISSGCDDTLEEVMAYGLAIIAECQAKRVVKVLCDERELRYRLSTCDTFALATFLAEHVPLVSRVAVVCNPEGVPDAEFWENVAVNRGLTVRVFMERAEAETWLRGS